MENKPKRRWASSLCGCLSYKDPKGKSRFFPDFCPTAVICSNMAAGRVCSRAYHEKVCCLGLGPTGCLVCLVGLPVGIYSPVGGLGFFCCLSSHLRKKIVREYDVEEETCCTCCGSWNPCIDQVHFGLNYPCSLFQMLVSVEQWEYESTQQLIVSTPAPPVAMATVVTPVRIN